MPKGKRKRKKADYPSGVKGARTQRTEYYLRKPASIIQVTKPYPNLRTAGFLGLENKYVDHTYSGAIAAAWAGAEADPAGIGCLAAPQQGTGESNREGRNIKITSLAIQGYIYKPKQSDQDDTEDACVVHIAVVLDTQTNGAQLSAENVYVDADHVEVSFRELEYRNRFKVLWSRIYTIQDSVAFTDAANQASIASPARVFKIYKTLDLPVEFKANAGAIADVVDNSLHVIACASASGVSLKYQSRVRFVG